MKYAYTASPGKTSDDKFEIEKLKKPHQTHPTHDVPNRKAMRVMQGDSLSEFMNPKAGAGRGRQGGPTAKELKEEPMTAGQKQSMQEAKDEEAYQKRKTAPTTKTEMGKAFAKGGMTASSRADGIAQRGKTRGKIC